MGLTIVSNCEEDEIIDPFCVDDGCIPKRELARVRSIANYRMGWFKNVFKPLLTAFSTAQTADPYNQSTVDTAYNALLAAWQQGMADKNVYVIAETNGSFDGGSPLVGPGYGDQKERLIGYTFVLNGIDPLPGGNFAHWNTITKASNWGTAFRSETFTHFTEVATSKTFKQEIADDIAGERTIAVETKWDGEQPAPYADLVELFKCSAAIVTPVPSFGFSTQPQGKVVALGEAASLTGAAVQNATGTPVFKWQKKNGVSYANVVNSGTGQNTTTASGMNTSVLAFSAASADDSTPPFDEGVYRLQVTDDTSTPIYSNDVTLSVLDSKFTFVANAQGDTTNDGGSGNTGVSFNAGGTDANKAIAFDKEAVQTGSPLTATLKVSGTTVMVVNYPNNYAGKAFRYTHTDGSLKYGTFPSSTSDVNL